MALYGVWSATQYLQSLVSLTSFPSQSLVLANTFRLLCPSWVPGEWQLDAVGRTEAEVL